MSKKKSFLMPEEEYQSRYSAYRTDRKEEQKPENAKGTLLRFIALIKPHAVPMAFVVLFSMASTVCNVVAPDYLGDIILHSAGAD